MRKIRFGVVVLWIVLCSATTVSAQVSIGIGLPHVSIGINLPVYPEFVPVRGYPVYYAPRVAANYFFYDGLYWIFLDDYWYASYWYNGPWWIVEPEIVPVYILRIPVRYYRHPPPYFRGWRPDAPPRWGDHWGHEWKKHRRGWDTWRRDSVPARAPLPVYQRKYSGDRYPSTEQQQTLHRKHYRYQPRDRGIRQHFIQRGEKYAPGPASREREAAPRMKRPEERLEQRAPTPAQRERREGPRMRGPEQRIAPPPQQPYKPPRQSGPEFKDRKEQPRVLPHERQAPRPQTQDQMMRQSGKPRETGRDQGQRPKKEEER